jgi:ATP-binding cassette subfamily B protein
MRLVRVNNLFMPTIMLLIGASSMLSVFIGGSMVLSGGIKTAIIVTFMMFIYKLTWPFASVGWVTSIIQRAAASQSRINDFLKTEPTIRTNVGEKIESLRTIRFLNCLIH